MEHAIRWARGTGIITRIELLVYERNSVAIRLYESLGFRSEGVRRNAIFDAHGCENEIAMALLV
jgi:RimJ/RimL family protein N-acetyltransferase